MLSEGRGCCQVNCTSTTERFIYDKDIELQPPQVECKITFITAFERALSIQLEYVERVFTFRRDEDEYRVTKSSKLFPTKHFAANPNLVIDASSKPVKGAMCAFHKVHLR